MQLSPRSRLDRHKPAVHRRFAQVLVGLVWLAVGGMLVGRAGAWILEEELVVATLLVTGGLAGGALFWELAFTRVVRKNLDRLAAMPDRMCVFGMQSWKGWALVALMVPMGILLRHSPLDRSWLAGPYLAMGAVLLGGGLAYARQGIRPRAPPGTRSEP